MATSARIPPVYFVVSHTPGPAWKAGLPFRQQPGIMEHVRYYQVLHDGGRVIMGGPFLDDSGGMMVLAVGSEDDARRMAGDDPAVRSGLLTVVVHPWMASFSPAKQ